MRILRQIRRFPIHKYSPKNPWGDTFVGTYYFLRDNRRMPNFNQGNYNDFLFFLKTSPEIDRPIRHYVSDKLQVKQFVDTICGNGYTVPTWLILNTPDEVGKTTFPEQCVIKPTHMSGEVIIRREGEPINLQRIETWFKINFYNQSRERNYRYLVPRVIVEPLLPLLTDSIEYKIHCLRGKPKIFSVLRNLKLTNRSSCCYDTSWNNLGFALCSRFAGSYRAVHDEVPQNFNKILTLCENLAQYFNSIRIDILPTQEEIYIGELTNTPSNASILFEPAEGEKIFNDVYFDRGHFCRSDFRDFEL